MSTSESKETTAVDSAPVAVQAAQPAVETGLQPEPAGEPSGKEDSEEEDSLPEERDENGEIITPPQVPGSQPRGRIRPPTQGGSGKPTSGRPK